MDSLAAAARGVASRPARSAPARPAARPTRGFRAEAPAAASAGTSADAYREPAAVEGDRQGREVVAAGGARGPGDDREGRAGGQGLRRQADLLGSPRAGE